MPRAAYDASLAVSAAWALEFAPVNVSVVLVQCDGNEHFCIASFSWFFEELAASVAELREQLPFRIHEHIIPPEPDDARVWQTTFEDLRLLNVTHAPELPDNKRMLLTQAFLRRLHIDTAARPWAPEGNNAELVDSLNGYRVKELASHSDVFTLNVLATHEQYLSRAIEHYAAWEWKSGPSVWSAKPDYSQHDKAVI